MLPPSFLYPPRHAFPVLWRVHEVYNTGIAAHPTVMEYVFLIFIFIIAGIVPELTGFGVATVSMALLPFLFPLTVAIPLVAIIQTLATGIISFQGDRKIAWRYVLPLVFGAAVGIPFGILFFHILDEDLLKLFLAIFLITYALYGILKQRTIIPRNMGMSAAVGVVAGFFNASFNIHGPLIGMYAFQNKNLSNRKNKEVIAVYMFIAGICTVVGHAVAGHVTEPVFALLPYAIPALLIGLYVGSHLFRRLQHNGRALKAILYVFVLAAGIGLLF